MILTRTPLRVSFCGGGSDLPSFYSKNGGCVVSTAIDKYVYLAVHKSFYPDTYILKYSDMERVSSLDDMRHPIFRECLRECPDTGALEITSMADVPAGTGMGSSSSFTVGLINALRAYQGLDSTPELLASEACRMEIDVLNESIGKQDQYAAAYGGMNFIRFNKDGHVDVEPLSVDKDVLDTLESNLLMMYVGGTRSASAILSNQSKNIASGSAEERQMRLCRMAERLRDDLENGDADALGRNLDEGWRIKKTLANGISSGDIDGYYEAAMENGAIGGKLLGAGGGGFLLMYVPKENRQAVIDAMSPCREMPFRLNPRGSEVVFNDMN